MGDEGKKEKEGDGTQAKRCRDQTKGQARVKGARALGRANEEFCSAAGESHITTRRRIESAENRTRFFDYCRNKEFKASCRSCSSSPGVEEAAIGLHLFQKFWYGATCSEFGLTGCQSSRYQDGAAKEDSAGNVLWKYFKWDWEKNQLVEDKEPLPHITVNEQLELISQSCAAQGAILRFHSTQPLAKERRSPVTFLLSIGMQEPQSLVLCRALMKLCGSGSSKVLKKRVRLEQQQPLSASATRHSEHGTAEKGSNAPSADTC